MGSKLLIFVIVLGVGIQATITFGDTGYLHEGSLVGWGYNGNGETNVPTGNNYTQISSRLSNGLALKSDGSLVGWGWNDWGQAPA